MIVSFLCLLAAFSPQAPAQDTIAYVVSIVTETTGDDVSLRFVLTGPPSSYSAVREGDEIAVRIAAEALPGLTLPANRAPIRSLVLGSEEGFSLLVGLSRGGTFARAHSGRARGRALGNSGPRTRSLR